MESHNNTGELKHYGVLGMRWGVRKDRRYIGSEQRTRNAASAGERVRSSVLSKNLGTTTGSLRRATNAANKATNKAQKKSIRDDNTYNRGLKYEQKLNRMSTRRDQADDRYKRSAFDYNRTDTIAKRYMTSDQYSKWSTSAVRKLHGKSVNSLQKRSEASKAKVDKYINKLSNKYVLMYDGSTKYYTLKVKG